MPKKTSFFSKKLISWYLTNKRDLPWRSTSNPYFIWLSEVILQQTRVAQGLPYYLQFIKAFPTIEQLAAAPETKILKLWQGLGYYSRARNMHFTAKYIVNSLNGKFPTTSQGLLQLKGVGDYTASAIASICYNEPAAVVDGNVYRVLSRVFGIFTPINETRGIKEFKALAQELIDPEQPGRYNQAVMEFGARYCVPQNPDCEGCIFNDRCEAFRMKKVGELPVKIKKLQIKKRYFNYIVPISADNKTILQQRKGKGIWQQLYEFPLIEQPSAVNIEELKQLEEFQTFSANYCAEDTALYNETPIVHKLSHQHLYTHFWIVEVSNLEEKGIPFSEVSDFAVPVLIQNFISNFSQWNH
ncbi:A/G-specific DNA-adenine glycosylase [Ulvibacter sp. MAR_2010_11]|uniref:A/G-specific adenine glycosylase n=1 Tax=Ulvibacter sp. MAR_2010_11 TaxID=1250229 RepID=UPI000C2CD8B0|nr:A/G-specific adenine glycosylase [Ulvibacter sp. MAR_2010_11]PKA82706.1 A/G-specific DNA-adenine glycosylase [Ulvibacter sp. MAR_2010_11]